MFIEILMKNDLTFTEAPRFYLFLLVHAAYADYQMHSKEVRFILNKLKEILPDRDVYEEFLVLKDHYENLSNGEIEKIIAENFPRFLGDITQQNLLTWLGGVITADGVVKDSEMEFFNKVHQTIQDPTVH